MEREQEASLKAPIKDLEAERMEELYPIHPLIHPSLHLSMEERE